MNWLFKKYLLRIKLELSELLPSKKPEPPVLSPRAQALYDRLLAGEFYRWGDKRTPKAMAELEALGLVGTMGRVETIVRCWVPSGSVPLQAEQIKA